MIKGYGVKGFIAALFVLCCINVYGEPVVSSGEAVIKDNDIVSAKHAAILRAKWSAVEQVSPMGIKIDTVMGNAAILDEGIKTEVSASIKSFEIIDEKVDKNIYKVTIRADVISDERKHIVNGSKNMSVFVMIAGVMPDGTKEYDQPFTDAVMRGLSEKGFEVSGASLSGDKKAVAALDKALKSSDYGALKDIFDKTSCANIIIGSIKVIDKGSNAGYANVGFKMAGGELTWKLLEESNGKIVQLASGSLSGRGQGASIHDAAFSLYKSMGKSAAVKLVSGVSEKILGENAKSVRIVLRGADSLDDIKELKDDLKNIPFVLNVKDGGGLSSIIVDYPEKTYYLGLFLEKNGKYSVRKLTDNEIVLEK